MNTVGLTFPTKWSTIEAWFSARSSRIIYLVVTFVVAFFLIKWVTRLTQTAFNRTKLPSATLFINIIRIFLWFIAVLIVLKPVFGITPSTFIAALGVGGLAVSLGLQDTISNLVGGFTLMMGKVISPGDTIKINDSVGTVKDITWRHTIIRERTGSEIWIPNSVLNSTQLEKLPTTNAAFTTVPFVMRGDTNVSMASKRILELVGRATSQLSLKKTNPSVRFTGFSPYGITGEIVLYAAHGVSFAQIADAASRAIAGEDYIVQNGSEEPLAGPVPVEDNQETIAFKPSKQLKQGEIAPQAVVQERSRENLKQPSMVNPPTNQDKDRGQTLSKNSQEAQGNPYVNRILKKLVSATESRENRKKRRNRSSGAVGGKNERKPSDISASPTNPEVIRQIGVVANPDKVEAISTTQMRRFNKPRHSGSLRRIGSTRSRKQTKD